MNFTEDSSDDALSEISRAVAAARSRDDVDSHYGTSGHRANLITIAFSIPFTIYMDGGCAATDSEDIAIWLLTPSTGRGVIAVVLFTLLRPT